MKYLKSLILKEFYRTELRDGETTINNSISSISKYLGIKHSEVYYCIKKELAVKEKNFKDKINNK